jgi:hypothetical protein
VHVQGILPARRSRSHHVQAHARHDRRQPSPQVVDTTDIRAAHPDPGFLDGVLNQQTWSRPDAAQWAEACNALFPPYQLLIESYSKAQEVVTQHEQLDSVLA